MGILLAHEMGHFLQALRYHVPASLPFFIPMPISQLGTMGAVIGMQGSNANRKELFDIGLSGPWAGLVVAIPVSIAGILQASYVVPPPGIPADFADPLIFRLLMAWFRPDLPEGAELIMNPLLMAGWVGMLITGLNMLPVSQLDGGHVTYAPSANAHYIARGFLLFWRPLSYSRGSTCGRSCRVSHPDRQRSPSHGRRPRSMGPGAGVLASCLSRFPFCASCPIHCRA